MVDTSRDAWRIRLGVLGVIWMCAQAGVAAANPSINAYWTHVNGVAIGATTSLAAERFDILRLEIELPISSVGFAGASVTARYNSVHLFLLEATECPSPPNPIDQRCSHLIPGIPIIFPLFDPVAPGVSSYEIDGERYMGEFDAITPDGTTFYPPGRVVIGEAYFDVEGTGSVEVGFFSSATDGYLDGNFVDVSASIPTASAYVTVPEPLGVSSLCVGGAWTLSLATIRRRHMQRTFPSTTRGTAGEANGS